MAPPKQKKTKKMRNRSLSFKHSSRRVPVFVNDEYGLKASSAVLKKLKASIPINMRPKEKYEDNVEYEVAEILAVEKLPNGELVFLIRWADNEPRMETHLIRN